MQITNITASYDYCCQHQIYKTIFKTSAVLTGETAGYLEARLATLDLCYARMKGRILNTAKYGNKWETKQGMRLYLHVMQNIGQP